MNRKTYILDRNSPLILYGAAFMATVVYEKLKKDGVRIAGFMDKRAGEIGTFFDLPVYSPDAGGVNRNNAVILITVKNVFEHSRIAQRLMDMGYCRIIYLPFDTLNGLGSETEQEIGSCYRIITEGDGGCYPLEIPFAVEDNASGSGMAEAVGTIRDMDDEVTAWIPVTLIFTNKVADAPSYPLLFLKPHIDFVRYVLARGNGSTEDYLEYCTDAARQTKRIKVTSAWKENVIANRYEVISHMNHMYNVSPEFFVTNAPSAEWDQEVRRFHLTSGKHRAAYLCAMDRNYLPIRVSRKDWRDYCNSIDSDGIRKSYRDRHIAKGFAVPTENPCLYEWSSIAENYWFSLLRYIMEALRDFYWNDVRNRRLQDLDIYVGFDEDGFFSRYLERCGWKVNAGKKEEYDFALLRGDNEGIRARHRVMVFEEEPDGYDNIEFRMIRIRDSYVVRE